MAENCAPLVVLPGRIGVALDVLAVVHTRERGTPSGTAGPVVVRGEELAVLEAYWKLGRVPPDRRPDQRQRETDREFLMTLLAWLPAVTA